MTAKEELQLLKDIEQASKYYCFMAVSDTDGHFIMNTEDQFIKDNLTPVRTDHEYNYYNTDEVTELLPNLIIYELIKQE